MGDEKRKNPLEERGRYPHEDEPADEGSTGPAADPEIARPEKVDPSTQETADEVDDSDREGQEGVGPGSREAIKRQEKGERPPKES